MSTLTSLWRYNHWQLQAYICLASLPRLYVDFREGPRSCQALNYNIGAVASLSVLSPPSYSYIYTTLHKVTCFLQELRESLPTVVSWFTSIWETVFLRQALELRGVWNTEMSKDIRPKTVGNGGACSQLEGTSPPLLSTGEWGQAECQVFPFFRGARNLNLYVNFLQSEKKLVINSGIF